MVYAQNLWWHVHYVSERNVTYILYTMHCAVEQNRIVYSFLHCLELCCIDDYVMWCAVNSSFQQYLLVLHLKFNKCRRLGVKINNERTNELHYIYASTYILNIHCHCNGMSSSFSNLNELKLNKVWMVGNILFGGNKYDCIVAKSQILFTLLRELIKFC